MAEGSLKFFYFFHQDYSVEAHQERMNFQRARIAKVNQHLHTLVESSEKVTSLVPL